MATEINEAYFGGQSLTTIGSTSNAANWTGAWTLQDINNNISSLFGNSIPRFSKITEATFDVHAKENGGTFNSDISVYFGNSSNGVVKSLLEKENCVYDSGFSNFSINLTDYVNSDGQVTYSGADRVCVKLKKNSSLGTNRTWTAYYSGSLSYDCPQIEIKINLITPGDITPGTVTGRGVYEVNTIDYAAKLTATLNEGFVFGGWYSDSLCTTKLSDELTYSAPISQNNISGFSTVVTYYARFFKATNTVDATINQGEGTVTGTGEYARGSTVTVVAVPDPGWKFLKWGNGETSAARTLTVDHDTTVGAFFTPVIVTYDNIFNFFRWKEKGITSGRGTVANVNDYLFDFTASVDDAYTGYSHMFKVESGKKYTFRYAVGGSGTSRESFVFFHDTEGDYSWTKLASSTASEWDFTVPDGYSWASIRFDVNTKGETITYGDVRIYPANCSYMGNTVLMTDRLDKAGWSMPTPTRSGYKFKGWNTKVDGSGKFYTASDAYPTDDLVLYSIWETNKILINTFQPFKIYIDKKEVKQIYQHKYKVYG